MTHIAYLRVSTDAQDTDNQRLAILDYAQQHDIQIDHFIRVIASSRRNTADRRLDDLMELIQPGDTLLVAEMSRLGRSISEIVRLVDELVERKIHFIALKENIKFCGEKDMQTTVMITIFALLAELERTLISQRTRDGLAKAVANGVKLGRKPGVLCKSTLDPHRDIIIDYLQRGVSMASIAKIIGINPGTLRNYVITRKIKRP